MTFRIDEIQLWCSDDTFRILDDLADIQNKLNEMIRNWNMLMEERTKHE